MSSQLTHFTLSSECLTAVGLGMSEDLASSALKDDFLDIQRFTFYDTIANII